MLARISFSNKSQVILFSLSGQKDVKKQLGAVEHGAAVVIAYYRFREGWLSPVVDETVFASTKFDYDVTMSLYTSQQYEKAAKRQAFEQQAEELFYNAFRKEQAGEKYANLPAITALLMGREWHAPSEDDIKRRRIIRQKPQTKLAAEAIKEAIQPPGNIYYTTEDILALVKKGAKGKAYHADRKCGMITKTGGTIVALAENYDEAGILTKMKQCKRCAGKVTAAEEVVNPLEGAKEEMHHMPDGDDRDQSILITEHLEETTEMVKGMQNKISEMEEHATHQENQIEKLKHENEGLVDELHHERRKMKADELISLFEQDLLKKAKSRETRNDEVGALYRALLFLKGKAK